MSVILWPYRQYVIRSGRFILSQHSPLAQIVAGALVLLPWAAILVLCVLVLARMGVF